ncbi:MAG: LLM class flavin-dependent oxidoreductase [Nocardioidaceae bacterium]
MTTSSLKHGVYCANFNFLAEPHVLHDLALRSEAAGWDGFFIYDHVVPRLDEDAPVGEAWTTLGAIAATTTRLKIGPMITAVARRLPWELAQQAIAVDRLSEGRLILGVGLGSIADHRAVSPQLTPADLGARLDEGLDVVEALLAGERVDHDGTWPIRGLSLQPGPWNDRIPIWVGGRYGAAKPALRAARYQGYFPIPADWDGRRPGSVEGVTGAIEAITAARGDVVDFDIVVGGVSDPDTARSAMAPYEAAGATWWVEVMSPERGTLEQFRARIDAGPLGVG